jgi:hypothetical protein
MTTVDITLGTTHHKSNTLNELTICNLIQIYVNGFDTMHGFINIKGSDAIIDKSTREVCNVMTSDFDLLISDANTEITKAKELIKRKYPIRNRYDIVKLFFKNPKLFIYAYNRINAN